MSFLEKVEASVEVSGMLRRRYRKDTDRAEWALVSKTDPKKILKWFGVKHPSEEAVQEEEKRVQFFKAKG